MKKLFDYLNNFCVNVLFLQLPTSMGPECDIIFQKEIHANINLHYGSSTVSQNFIPFFFKLIS